MGNQFLLNHMNIVVLRWALLLFRTAYIFAPMIFIFFIWKPTWIAQFRVYDSNGRKHLWIEEILRSIVSLSTYSIPVLCMLLTKQYLDYSMMYTEIEQYGTFYFVASILIFITFIDTCFYWCHRWMHTYSFLKKTHSIHHRSYNLSPASAYSFGLKEAFINMAPYWFLVMVMPWHPYAVLIFTFLAISHLGYIHLGYDFAYDFKRKNLVLKWLNTSTHHALHHQHGEGNYGLFFTFWDKLMKTERIK